MRLDLLAPVQHLLHREGARLGLAVVVGDADAAGRRDLDPGGAVRDLVDAVALGPGRLFQLQAAELDGIKAAGKTGTTNAYRDAWFVGYTPDLVAGDISYDAMGLLDAGGHAFDTLLVHHQQ